MSTFANLYEIGNNEPFALVTSDLHSPLDIIVQNIDGTDNVLVGDHNLNPGNFGVTLSPGMGISISLGAYDELYVMSSGNDGNVISVLKTAGKGK